MSVFDSIQNVSDLKYSFISPTLSTLTQSPQDVPNSANHEIRDNQDNTTCIDQINQYIHRHHTSASALCCPQNASFVTSYGIIAVRRTSDFVVDISGLVVDDAPPNCPSCFSSFENCNFTRQVPTSHRYNVLLLQRKHTNAFVDIIKGNYISTMLLPSLISELTCEEKRKIRDLKFEDLWRCMWLYSCKKNAIYSPEYKRASQIYRRNISCILVQIESSKQHNVFTEFGFPKGRKNRAESGLQCAIREFCEESGYFAHELEIIDYNFIIKEEFIGSDNQYYRHIYYLAQILTHRQPSFNEYDINQGGEIRNLGWFSYPQASTMFRQYDITKMHALDEAKKKLNTLGINLYQQCETM